MPDQTPAPKWGEPSWSAGHHNTNMEASFSRIVEGASWKRQNTIVLLPAAKMVPMKCAHTWMDIMYPPNNAVHKFALLGQEVGQAYSSAIEALLEHPQLKDTKYLLTIEHDNTVPPDGAIKLMARMDAHPELAAISGLYWTKGPQGVPQIWGDPKDPVVNFRPQPPDPRGGLVECVGTGMGFVLWRWDMFKDKRLRRPWFKTTNSREEGCMTQDLYFWTDARKYGYRCAVDCSVLVGHYDAEADFNW